MSRATLVTILAALGLGGAAGQISNLDGALPIVAQVVVIVAIIVLGLWRGLPDANRDGVPDVIERWPRAVAIIRQYVLPALLAILAMLGVAASTGCGANLRWVGASASADVLQLDDGLSVSGQVSSTLEIYGRQIKIITQYAQIDNVGNFRRVGACVIAEGWPRVCGKWSTAGGWGVTFGAGTGAAKKASEVDKGKCR